MCGRSGVGFNLGVVGAVGAFVAGTVGGAALAATHLRRQVANRVSPRPDPDLAKSPQVLLDDQQYLRRAVSYGAKAHTSNLLTFLNYRADLFLVNVLLSPAAAGVYVVAVQIAERLWMLSQSVNTVLFPKLSQLHRDEDARRALTPLIARIVLMLSGLGALVLAVLAKPLVVLIFGTIFAEAAIAILWLLPGIVAGAMARVLGHDLAARGRVDLNLYTSVLVLIVNVLANLLLISAYGISGAAIATSIAYGIDAIAKLILYARLSRNSWWSPLVPHRTDWRALTGVLRRGD